MEGFETKYPEIEMEYQGFRPRDFVPRFYQERQVGKYLCIGVCVSQSIRSLVTNPNDLAGTLIDMISQL